MCAENRILQSRVNRFPERTSSLEVAETSEQDMQPKSESTRLEGPNGLEEYKGSDKLKDKKAIITGGEYRNIYHR